MSKELKVLHIIDSLGLGGAQTVVKGIFEYQKDNKNIFLFALRKRKILIEVAHQNVTVFNSEKKYSLKPLFELRDLIRREKIDILHCHLFRSNVFGIVLKIIWFPKIKLIVHEHGGILEDGFVYRFFLRYGQRKIDTYIAISEYIKRSLIKFAHIKEDKISLLYNFVDLKKFNRDTISWDINDERKKYGVNKDDFLVGFVGRIVERKGWRNFVSVAIEISKDNKNIKFIIAGDGVQKNELLTILEKNKIKNEIIYLGHVSDIVRLYSILDTIIVPSHWEPMGLTELEAQAMGVPVIASDVDGLNEVIKDRENALLFKIGDIKMLKELICEVYRNNQVIEFLKDGMNKNIGKYNLISYVEKLLNIYKILK
jgi:glycosyltransferase involved in cell wall biosynthesis